jgi:hypothetical protein
VAGIGYSQHQHIRVWRGNFGGEIGEFIQQPFRIVPIDQKMGVMRSGSSQPSQCASCIAGQYITAAQLPRRAVDGA